MSRIALDLGFIQIYWYSLMIALALLVGSIFMVLECRRQKMDEDKFVNILFWGVIFAIIGARAYYVLFRLDYYMNYPEEMIRIWEGGLAIYGGLISGVIVIFLTAKIKRFSALSMLDLITPACMLGQSIGRWGNFMNREAYGRMTEIFCRMGLQTNNGEFVYVHPTFLYESLWNLIGFFFLSRFLSKGKRKYPGQCALLYFLWYGLGRMWIEGLRTDSLMLGNTGIRVSQLLSLFLAFTAAILLILNRRRYETD